jgi:23S rRNA pseudouridine1911/1915/1917 synthase
MAARSRRPREGARPTPVNPTPPPEGQEEFELVLTAADAGHRLDLALARHWPDRSRAEIQRLIRSGHVTAGVRPVKAGTAVSAGLRIRVTVPARRPATPAPQDLPLAFLYDDEDVVVVDKPAGMVVHPAAGHHEGTMVNALLHHVGGLSGVGGEDRPGIVHRLDRGTSGVMVVAKHDRAHRSLARQFHDREVTKEYVALVWGRPRAGQIFDQPIGRDSRHRQRMTTRARRARTALTRIASVEPLGRVSLVRLIIGTGRTHQIRVHLSESGHPVVGDAVYGGRRERPGNSAVAKLDRPFLHASRLTFSHPGDGRRMSVEAPLPPDLAATLARLRESRP